MTEMVPGNETVDDWSEMVTTQIFFKLGGVSPPDFLETLGKRWAGDCPNSTHGKLYSGMASGYPVSMLQLSCPRNPQTGKPEVALIRAIKGARTLYVVQYAYRQSAGDELVSKAAHYLGTVNVRDAGSRDHPCSKAFPPASPH